MHFAQGLEFRAVAVLACDDEVIPRQQRIETVGDDADFAEVYDTEPTCSTLLAPVLATSCCYRASCQGYGPWTARRPDVSLSIRLN